MKTVREETRGALTLRIVEGKSGYSGVILAKTGGRLSLLQDSDPVSLWRRLEEAAACSSKEYFGFDGARARFLHFFPQGFASAEYAKHERTYKDEAKARLDASVPIEAALRADGLGHAALAAFRDTNLLSPFEKMRVADLLRGPSADAFLRAAGRFTIGVDARELSEMAALARLHDCAKWTVLTYLPFFWRPDAHMFLKPEVTKDFAARVGHPFIHAFTADISMPVYDALRDLAARTEQEIIDLKPRDRIDVQSFIWIVGAYTDPLVP